DHALATVIFHGFTFQGVLAYRDKGVPTAYFGADFNDQRDYNAQENDYIDLSYQHSIGSSWQLNARSSWDQASLIGPVPADGTSTPQDVYTFHGEWWNSTVQRSRSLFDKHKLTFGSEITDNFRQDQSNLDPDLDPPLITIPYDSVIWAIYGQAEFAITQKLS